MASVQQQDAAAHGDVRENEPDVAPVGRNERARIHRGATSLDLRGPGVIHAFVALRIVNLPSPRRRPCLGAFQLPPHRVAARLLRAAEPEV